MQEQSQLRLYETPLKSTSLEWRITENRIFRNRFEYGLNRDLEALSQEYSLPKEKIIEKCGNWREVLLAWVSSIKVPEKQYHFIELTPISNYRARLQREFGLKEASTNLGLPAIITGITISNDEQIIAGVRGGNVHTGRICLAPCGYVSAGEHFNDPYFAYVDSKGEFKGGLFEKNPIFRAYYQELYEELGLMKWDLVKEPVIIGEFYDHEYTKGVTYAFLAEAKFSAEDILKKQESAKDAWEFQNMLQIEADKNTISKFLAEKELLELLVLGKVLTEKEKELLVLGKAPLTEKEKELLVLGKAPLAERGLLVLGRAPLELYSQYVALKIEPRIIHKP